MLDDYLLLCLGSGEKISGSNTSLWSEFSVQVFLVLSCDDFYFIKRSDECRKARNPAAIRR